MALIVGRREIMASLHCIDWRTVRQWKLKYKLPIRYLPNGRPFMIPEELHAWLLRYSDLKKS